MRAAIVAILLAAAFRCAGADDITFTNRVETFTNLQGHLYSRVQLVRGDQDGLIWRDGASGGRICYTNLHPDVLEDFGISSNRIEIARARAEKKALADARYRAQPFAQARTRPLAPVATNQVDTAAPWLDGPAVATVPQPSYPINPMYPNAFPFGFGFPFDSSAPSAPSAASAPGANSAAAAPQVPRAPVAPNTGSAPNVPAAPNMGRASSAPSAPSAPIATGRRH